MDLLNLPFSIAENPAFWLLWTVTAVVCGVSAANAIRRRDQILGFIPVFVLAFSYFYVFQAAVVALTLSDRLEPWMFTFGQGMALACLLAVLWGNYLGSHPVRVPRKPREYSYKPQSLWYSGVAMMLVGIVAQYRFYGAVVSGVDDYSGSAYWYVMFLIFYPGLGICIRLYAGTQQYHTPAVLLLLITLSTIFLYFWVLQVRRGPMFPFFVVSAYTYYLTTRKVNRAVLVSGLVFVGLLMLFFVFIRDYSHREGSWRSEQLNRVTVQNVLLQKAQAEGDNEYLYHCGYSACVYELGRYQYGTGYLNLFIHWIPRQWWPDKPTLLDQGWFPRVQRYEMREVVGWEMTPGAAITGVAEAFQQYGWFAPAFWFALGWTLGRMYALAFYRPTAARNTLYVGLIAVTHWLVSQGFIASFVPAMFYSFLPLVVMYFFRERRKVLAHPRPRTALAEPRPARTLPPRPLRQPMSSPLP